MKNEAYSARRMCEQVASDPAFAPMQKRRNTLRELGLTDREIEDRIRLWWTQILHDPAYGFALQTAEDEACFVDTGNDDVRTEGQSYAMLMSVMIGDRIFFDNVWRWTLRHMYLTEGPCRGYFGWSYPLDGRGLAGGPAPDGEAFFILALIAADKRWGSETGHEELDYAAWAQRLLYDVLHREEGEAGPLWQDNGLIAFVPDCGFTDPSYLLPHSYVYYAEYAVPEDRARWLEMADISAAFLGTHAHPETGFYPEYAHNDGRPETTRGHGDFYSDAYRCMINSAVDSLWNGVEPWHVSLAERQAAFFAPIPTEAFMRYALDGRPTQEPSLHPIGLLASLATTRIIVDNPDTTSLAKRFITTPLRQGDRRYYDNLLGYFAWLALAGWYTL